MANPRRRYFVAEGPDADKLQEQVLAAHNDHRERLKSFLAQSGTSICNTSGGIPTRLMFPEGADIPPGLKQERKQTHECEEYLVCKPVLNTKAGKAIKAQMRAVGGFNISDLVCSHYKCGAMIYGGDGSMWCATGWVHVEKGVVVIQVPEDDVNPYTPHPTFREIKKSEYIALTEE